MLPASENLLVSHFCKGTAFVFSRQIKESICILNGHCGRENCVEGFRWFLDGAGCARVGRSLVAASPPCPSSWQEGPPLRRQAVESGRLVRILNMFPE